MNVGRSVGLPVGRGARSVNNPLRSPFIHFLPLIPSFQLRSLSLSFSPIVAARQRGVGFCPAAAARRVSYEDLFPDLARTLCPQSIFGAVTLSAY